MPLVGSEFAFVAFRCQFREARLRHPIGAQLHQSARAFRGQATGDWVKQPIQYAGGFAVFHAGTLTQARSLANFNFGKKQGPGKSI
jgi:hypothetical protein